MRKQLLIALLGVVMTVSGVLSGPAYTAIAAEESGTGEQTEAAAEPETPAEDPQETAPASSAPKSTAAGISRMNFFVFKTMGFYSNSIETDLERT